VYSLGYQQGIIDCVKTPVALQSEILYSILLSMGLTRIDETTVEVIQETMLKPRALMMGKRGQIAHVGHRIVCAAREMVREELDAALIASASDMPQDATPEQIQLRAQQDPTVQFWTSARERLVGEEISNQPWQYIVIDSPSPNAFVTEVLPRRFFLTTSLLKVATTPDELAVVLGHESTCIGCDWETISWCDWQSAFSDDLTISTFFLGTK
jgi:Zn-dependent protease with chaperone function